MITIYDDVYKGFDPEVRRDLLQGLSDFRLKLGEKIKRDRAAMIEVERSLAANPAYVEYVERETARKEARKVARAKKKKKKAKAAEATE